MVRVLELQGEQPLCLQNSAALKVLDRFLVGLCRTSSCERTKILALPGLCVLFSGIEAILPVFEFADHDRINTDSVLRSSGCLPGTTGFPCSIVTPGRTSLARSSSRLI